VDLPALTALRGLAALAVLLFHSSSLVLHQASVEQPRIWGRGYLAVDFFFALSGFVIGLAYEARFAQGLAFGSFARIRLIRLYPVITLGVILGGLEFAFTGGFLIWRTEPFAVWPCVLLQMLFVPFAFSRTQAYPLDVVQWSLFFELFGNAVHALIVGLLSTRRLTWITGLAAVVVIYADWSRGTLSAGWSWANFPFGFARLAFSYSAGLLIYRQWRSGSLPKFNAGYLVAAALLFSALAAPKTAAIPDSVFVLFVFPVVLMIAVQTQPARRLSGIVKWMGEVSYPLYALQVPVLTAATFLILHSTSRPLNAMIEGAAIGVAVLLSWLAARYYDAPLRRWLMARTSRRPALPSEAAAA